MNFNDYYDITPEISEALAVFPGDTAYKRSVSMSFEKGDHLTLSSIQTTVHLGAHVDAPNHYRAQGLGMSQRSLKYYMGTCQVVDIDLPRGSRIGVDDFDLDELKAERVLFKTGSYPNPNQWNNDFCALSPELIGELALRSVILVGIDTPSVDLADCKQLLAHQQIAQNDMAIIEGVVLDEVPTGVYTLMALPLKLKSADASPVRALLFKGS